MSEAEAQLVRTTFAGLIPTSDAFCEGLYRRLFEQAPAVTHLFPEEMESQRDQLVMMLATAIDLVSRPEEFRSTCQECGARHRKYGAEKEQFAFVADLLFAELDSSIKPPMSSEQREAWKKLLQAVTEEMLTGFGRTDS